MAGTEPQALDLLGLPSVAVRQQVIDRHDLWALAGGNDDVDIREIVGEHLPVAATGSQDASAGVADSTNVA